MVISLLAAAGEVVKLARALRGKRGFVPLVPDP